LLDLIPILIQPYLITLLIIFLIGILQFLHNPTPLIDQLPIPLSIHHNLQPFLIIPSMLPSNGINNHQIILTIIQRHSTIQISFNSIPILINEFIMPILVLYQLIAILIKPMFITFGINLYAIALIIVSNYLITWENCDFVSELVLVMDVTVLILYHFQTESIVFFVLL
jgi:hypothetical protein